MSAYQPSKYLAREPASCSTRSVWAQPRPYVTAAAGNPLGTTPGPSPRPITNGERLRPGGAMPIGALDRRFNDCPEHAQIFCVYGAERAKAFTAAGSAGGMDGPAALGRRRWY